MYTLYSEMSEHDMYNNSFPAIRKYSFKAVLPGLQYIRKEGQQGVIQVSRG